MATRIGKFVRLHNDAILRQLCHQLALPALQCGAWEDISTVPVSQEEQHQERGLMHRRHPKAMKGHLDFTPGLKVVLITVHVSRHLS